MTEPTDYDGDDATLPLPGLEPEARPGAGELELAARRTIAALAAELDDRHAVMTQSLLVAARQLDRAAGSSKAKDYGVANLLVQLRETYLVLAPDAEGGGEGDAFDELAGELRCASGLCDHAEHRAPV